MAQFKGVTGGKLNVAVISAGDYFFPRLLVEFAGRHRGVILNFTVHNREGLLERIADNLTDLAIMVRPPMDLDTVHQPFAPHPYVIVAPPGHPLIGKQQISIAACCASRSSCARKPPTPGGRWRKASAGSRRLQHRDGDPSTETIKQAVIAGMGLSFLSAHTDQPRAAGGQPALLDVQGFPLMLNWYVVHRRNKRLPPVAQAFKRLPAQRRRIAYFADRSVRSKVLTAVTAGTASND